MGSRRRIGKLGGILGRQVPSYRQRTGHTAGKDTPLDGFRIDPVIALLSGIGGRTGQGSGAQVYEGVLFASTLMCGESGTFGLSPKRQ